ncbi:MAG: zinc ribbon domain-containing protein [Acidobacteria bacterium]|nr:zinc ribbon domain-containing protein [Acidobacteriota bacterium]
MNWGAADTKTTLKKELAIIPAVGWVVAGLVLVVLLTVVTPLLVRTVPPKSGEPVWLLWIVLPFASLICTIWLLMVFYVNADAARRQMNRLLWTLLVIFIPNAIGFIVYFLLRQPIARPCPKCTTLLKAEFVFCPSCGQELVPKCPSCRHAVEAGWLACAFCGAKLG